MMCIQMYWLCYFSLRDVKKYSFIPNRTQMDQNNDFIPIQLCTPMILLKLLKEVWVRSEENIWWFKSRYVPWKVPFQHGWQCHENCINGVSPSINLTPYKTMRSIGTWRIRSKNLRRWSNFARTSMNLYSFIPVTTGLLSLYCLSHFIVFIVDPKPRSTPKTPQWYRERWI